MQALNEAQRADDYRISEEKKNISLVTCNIASFELSFVEFRILQVSQSIIVQAFVVCFNLTERTLRAAEWRASYAPRPCMPKDLENANSDSAVKTAQSLSKGVGEN